jgi:hypothetical protein
LGAILQVTWYLIFVEKLYLRQMKCLAKNSKGERCQKKGKIKNLLFCEHHGFFKSDWFFLKNQVFKWPLAITSGVIVFILTTIVAWEIEEYWSSKRQVNNNYKQEISAIDQSINEGLFNILILPFGSSDYCEGEKILCERELKNFFNRTVGGDTLAPVNIFVESLDNNIETAFSNEDLINLGKKYKADLIIWGDYTRRCSWDTTKIVVNYLMFDEYIARYSGMTNPANSIAGGIENLSELAEGEIVGDLDDIVFWALGVREALSKRNFENGIKLLELL